jgi:hypothetical protein
MRILIQLILFAMRRFATRITILSIECKWPRNLRLDNWKNDEHGTAIVAAVECTWPVTVEAELEVDVPGAVIAPFPVVLGHAYDLNLATTTGSMYESLVAEVDANVGVGAAQGIEEDQISRLEFVPIYFAAQPTNIRGAARQQCAELVEDVTHETAAIEAGGRRISAVAIFDADE